MTEGFKAWDIQTECARLREIARQRDAAHGALLEAIRAKRDEWLAVADARAREPYGTWDGQLERQIQLLCRAHAAALTAILDAT